MTGIGHTQLTEFIAFLDMHSLSCDKYIKIQNNIAELIYESEWEEIKKSGEEDKRKAIECGDIDSDGIFNGRSRRIAANNGVGKYYSSECT
jgi:hypothetical protein